MAFLKIQKTLRMTCLALIAGFVALAVIFLLGMIYRTITQSIAASERTQFLETLFQDPIAVRLREENEEKCTPREREYYWVCGLVIEAKPTGPYGYCSSPERPLYYGSLEAGSQLFAVNDLAFNHSISISDTTILPSNDATPFAYSDVFPPKEILVNDPIFSGNISGFERTWATYRELPILFTKGSESWKLTQEEREALPISLTFRHPTYPLLVYQSVPLEDFESWRSYVDDAISSIEASVVSVDRSRNCSDPPGNVKFSFNRYNDGKIESLRNWIRDHSNP